MIGMNLIPLDGLLERKVRVRLLEQIAREFVTGVPGQSGVLALFLLQEGDRALHRGTRFRF